ncbi:hypothetical protein KJ713_03580 [Patescibacteria group bacterium]|nr:hypothetical protein [Patescibacteria group bacterium]
MKEEIEEIRQRWKTWPYKNTALLILSLIIFIYFADSDWLRSIINKIGSLGYFGAFFTGILFVSTFTVAPAVVILFDLADILNPLGIAVLAGAGAVIGDYFIFRFLKDRIFVELSPLFEKIGGSWIKKLFFSPYFVWLIPFAGAFIIMSPLPDEMGVGIIGLSKIKNWQFILVSFLLNAVGIFLVITIARSF